MITIQKPKLLWNLVLGVLLLGIDVFGDTSGNPGGYTNQAHNKLKPFSKIWYDRIKRDSSFIGYNDAISNDAASSRRAHLASIIDVSISWH